MILRFGTLLLLPLTIACVPPDEDGETSSTEGVTTTEVSTTEGALDGASATTTTSSVDATSSTAISTDPDPQDTTGTTGTSEGEAVPVCGDGELNGDEECDEGADNSDMAACTSQCKLAFCGDGLIQAGKEACDLESKNGDGSYGGCTDLCQLGPHCGDKVHQIDHEECDTLDPELADGSRCIACVWEANLIFISSEIFQGDLEGIEGADSKCQQLAAASKLPNPSSFGAWLSNGAESPQSRFSPPLGAFILTDGALVAASWADLTSGADLINAVSVDESKAAVGLPFRAWSNTSPEGFSLGGPDCDGWTSGAPAEKGSYGDATKLDTAWTETDTEWCFQKNRLYCLATG